MPNSGHKSIDFSKGVRGEYYSRVKPLPQEDAVPVDVSFKKTTLHVHFSDGGVVAVPLALYPRLMNANETQRSDWRWIGSRHGIHWPSVDEDISVSGLMRAIKEEEMDKLGLIAGNGRFPFLLLDAARARGITVVVAAIKEETDPEIDVRAQQDSGVCVHWMSLGELSKLIETFQREGVSQAVMAGQVKHKQIFSSIRPDWRLAKLLMNLRTRNTDMLLGAVAKVLGDEGIELISSTAYLEPMLAHEGALSARLPDEGERADIEYGLGVARGIAGFDLGQTVVIAAQACVAVEAMEGTDATIARAGDLFRTLDDEASTLRRSLTVVKVAKPKQDMRFDVPVVGVPTIAAMQAAGATCLAIEAGRTLLFDEAGMIAKANEAGIAVVGVPVNVSLTAK